MLKCLAAQFEPIMIALSGTRIIMLEEAAFNKEYAGKNWNHGAVVEIVLRKADGSL